MNKKVDWDGIIFYSVGLAEKYSPNNKRDGSRIYCYQKPKQHPKTHRANQLSPKEPFTCRYCGHFHAHSYVIGKKPKRCYKCRQSFEGQATPPVLVVKCRGCGFELLRINRSEQLNRFDPHSLAGKCPRCGRHITFNPLTAQFSVRPRPRKR